jgi:hypothetical protein
MPRANHFKNQYSRSDKKLTYKDLEKKLDRIFSEYVRLSNTVTPESEYCRCITCGKIYHWKEIHCGHFISRSVKATRFNEINCNPQCVNCNSFNQGKWLDYEQALIEKHGLEAVESLKKIARMGGKLDTLWVQTRIAEYSSAVCRLKHEKGI